jgi:hypothetical protein
MIFDWKVIRSIAVEMQTSSDPVQPVFFFCFFFGVVVVGVMIGPGAQS